MRKTVISLIFSVIAVAVFAVNASAAITAGYAEIGSSIEAEISKALIVFLPIAGVLIGILCAWNLGKQFMSGDTSEDFHEEFGDVDYNDDGKYYDEYLENNPDEIDDRDPDDPNDRRNYYGDY